MKTIKKLFFVFLLVLFAGALFACRKDKKKQETKSMQYEKVEEGFTDIQIINEKNELKRGTNPIVKDGKVKFGNHEFKIKKEFKSIYVTEMSGVKFNYLKAEENWNSKVVANMVETLFSVNRFSEIVGSLAVAYKVSSDGKTYQFQLRKNVPWVLNESGDIYKHDGKEQYLVADDFIASAEYLLNPINGSPIVSPLLNYIDGAEKFYKENNAIISSNKPEDKEKAEKIKKDPKYFSELFRQKVGIKAIKDNVIEYKLTEAISYFKSLLTYSSFMPVNRNFLYEKGTKFGASQNDILVNGPFRITEYTENKTRIFEINTKYFDTDHVYVDKITETFIDGSNEPKKIREMYESGKIDQFSINPRDIEGKRKYIGNGTKKDPEHNEATGVQTLASTTYYALFNFNRKSFEGSTKNETEKTDFKKAIQNTDLRLAFLYGLHWTEKIKMINENPDEEIYRRLSLPDLGQTKDGRDYVELVDEVFNQKNNTSVNLSGIENNKDPIYDLAKAKKFFEKAKAELTGKVTFPIVVEYVGKGNTNPQWEAHQEVVFRELEKTSTIDGTQILKFVANHVQNSDKEKEWVFRRFNYDINLGAGWGPDYQDPRTFLDTIKIDGDIFDSYGFTSDPAKRTAEENETINKLFGTYDNLLKEALKETDHDKRLRKMAEAEYNAIYESALIIPTESTSAWITVVGKVLPYTVNRTSCGVSGDKKTNYIVLEEALTSAQRKDLRVLFYKEKENKDIKEVKITLNGTKGWICPSTISGDKGSNISLPTPVQDKVEKAEFRKLFEGWYLDKELTKPVPADAKFENNTEFFLKEKDYIAANPKLKDPSQTGNNVTTGEPLKIYISKAENSILSPEYLVEKLKEDGSGFEELKDYSKAIKISTVPGDGFLFVALKVGTFRVHIRTFNPFETDIELATTISVFPNELNIINELVLNEARTRVEHELNESVVIDKVNVKIMKGRISLLMFGFEFNHNPGYSFEKDEDNSILKANDKELLKVLNINTSRIAVKGLELGSGKIVLKYKRHILKPNGTTSEELKTLTIQFEVVENIQ